MSAHSPQEWEKVRRFGFDRPPRWTLAKLRARVFSDGDGVLWGVQFLLVCVGLAFVVGSLAVARIVALIRAAAGLP